MRSACAQGSERVVLLERAAPRAQMPETRREANEMGLAPDVQHLQPWKVEDSKLNLRCAQSRSKAARGWPPATTSSVTVCTLCCKKRRRPESSGKAAVRSCSVCVREPVHCCTRAAARAAPGRFPGNLTVGSSKVVAASRAAKRHAMLIRRHCVRARSTCAIAEAGRLSPKARRRVLAVRRGGRDPARWLTSEKPRRSGTGCRAKCDAHLAWQPCGKAAEPAAAGEACSGHPGQLK